MLLTIEERKLFFSNWLRLLTFVNNSCNIIPDFGAPDNPAGLDIGNILKIRNKLWENSSLIDQYLKESDLNDEDFQIVNSWKKYINEDFIVIKELKKFCVMLDSKKEILYGVSAISNPLSEIIPFFPSFVKTALIPFKGRIIYDSIVVNSNVRFGSNYKKSLNISYAGIKKKKGIITVLE